MDNYSMNYTLYIAEMEMFESLTNIRNEYCLVESAQFSVIHEGIKETLINYMNKIVMQLKKIFAKIKSTITDKVSKYLDKVAAQIAKDNNINFTINNYKQYNFDLFNNTAVQPFDYIAMKDKLTSVPEFIKQQYSSLNNIEGSDVTGLFRKKCLTIIPKFQVTNKEILDMLNFCRKDFSEYLNDTIQKDMDAIDNSNKIISQLASTMSTNESVQLYSNMIYGVITEDGDNSKENKIDNSGETSSGANFEGHKERAGLSKAVNIFMTANTKIISAKLQMINEAFNQSAYRTLEFYYKSKKTNPSAVQNTKGNTTPQLKTIS